MRQIRTSGSMSGEGNQGRACAGTCALPRLYRSLP